MSPAEALNTKPAEGKTVVLIVDDEPAIREFLRRYLASKDFCVLTAATADAAREVWKEHNGRIDLLITDIVMPGMNGKLLAEHFRNECPGLKIIFMSGYLPEEIAAESLDHPFIRKPFRPSEMLDLIRTVLH